MENIQDFAGGTLIEYKTSRRFDQEFGRVRILQVITTSRFDEEIGSSVSSVEFKTDGKAFYNGSPIDSSSVREKDGVTYYFPPAWMRVAGSVCYAFAPHGVEIPLPEARSFNPMDLFAMVEAA
ncbi:MAG: hypothetical protein WC551_03480 [Patescibacteria group bacterium]